VNSHFPFGIINDKLWSKDDNLILDHEIFRNKNQMTQKYGITKKNSRDTTLSFEVFQLKLIGGSYELTKLWDP
jgi:hypothetical protein